MQPCQYSDDNREKKKAKEDSRVIRQHGATKKSSNNSDSRDHNCQLIVRVEQTSISATSLSK
jgi:hypothetical protein